MTNGQAWTKCQGQTIPESSIVNEVKVMWWDGMRNLSSPAPEWDHAMTLCWRWPGLDQARKCPPHHSPEPRLRHFVGDSKEKCYRCGFWTQIINRKLTWTLLETTSSLVSTGHRTGLRVEGEWVCMEHGIMGRRFPDNFLFFRPHLDV